MHSENSRGMQYIWAPIQNSIKRNVERMLTIWRCSLQAGGFASDQRWSTDANSLALYRGSNPSKRITTSPDCMDGLPIRGCHDDPLMSVFCRLWIYHWYWPSKLVVKSSSHAKWYPPRFRPITTADVIGQKSEKEIDKRIRDQSAVPDSTSCSRSMSHCAPSRTPVAETAFPL
jgi:hypothetical protein